MANFIDRVLAERRTLQEAVADIRAKHDRQPDPDLAEMIRHGEAEILDRRPRVAPLEPGDDGVEQSGQPREWRVLWPACARQRAFRSAAETIERVRAAQHQGIGPIWGRAVRSRGPGRAAIL